LIGAGILWGLTEGDDLPTDLMILHKEKGSEYLMGFMSGYKERTKQKKRGVRLSGGILGTVTTVIIFLYSSGGE